MYEMFEYIDDEDAPQPVGREPWNKHKLVGQKKPLKLKEVWEEYRKNNLCFPCLLRVLG